MLRRLSEFHRSTWECIISFIAMVGPILGVIVHCIYQISMSNALVQFRLGPIESPKYFGIGASYQDVLIFHVCIFIALIVGIALRYYHYRDERDFMRKYNVKDQTGFGSLFKGTDGKTDRYESLDSVGSD